MSELTRKKNEATEIMFAMVDSTTPANLKSGLTVADTAYYKDGAGAWTSLPITDTATEIGSTGMYTIELTAAEINHDMVMIKVTAAGAADSVVVIETFANDIDDVALASVCTETRLAELDAANLPTDVANVKTDTAAILIDTDTTIPGLINAQNDLSSAQVNTEVADVLRIDTIPDSYAADGAQPTIAQAVLAILQMMTEKSISGTTMTVKKPDGSTTAMTLTLDSETAPTSITRAT